MAKATAYTLIGDQLYKPGDTLPADHAGDDDSGGEPTGKYSTWKVGDLRAEIERRNAERDEDDPLAADGNKAALVAVLTADDAAAAAGNDSPE